MTQVVEKFQVLKTKKYDPTAISKKLAEQTSLLILTIKQPSFRKTVSTDKLVEVIAKGNEVQSEFDTNILHVSQEIIDRSEIAELSKLRNKFTQDIKSISLKHSFLKPGMYVIPTSMSLIVDNIIKKFIEDRDVLLDEFGANFDEIIQRQKSRSKELFDETDYEVFEVIRSRYDVEAIITGTVTQETLREIDERLFNEQKKLMENKWKNTVDEVQFALRESFQGMIAHFADSLTVDESTGKKKRFHETTIEKLTDFIDTFKMRNLTDDKELEKLTEKAKSLIEGLDVNQLRTDESIRDSLEKGFSQINEKATKMVEISGRKFDLE